jgi:hypothetical protein
MEHILHSNIMSHFEKHAIFTEAQHGFRSRRLCESFVDEAFMGDLIEGLGKIQENDVDLFPLR